MALRTFHSNPGLGGFGGAGAIPDNRHKSFVDESTESDAFLQIIKELVDNAVDACSSTSKAGASSSQDKRVRVSMERYEPACDGSSPTMAESQELLRISVSDNGVGMDDIQRSVNAFSSSKQRKSPVADVEKTQEEENDPEEAHTYGRYGIGLTLSILHGQRLVPNSSAQITSATALSSHWTSTVWIADISDDSIKCIKQWHVAKTDQESGTKISLLLPGGSTAERAWPRLQEYIYRFTFSINLKCRLEVLAPTLSKVPIYVAPPSIEEKNDGEDGKHSKGCGTSLQRQRMRERADVQTQLQAIRMAAQQYTSQPIELKDIAYSRNPIRLDPSLPFDPQGPKLEIAFIVAEATDEDEFDSVNDDWAVDAGAGTRSRSNHDCVDEPAALTCGQIRLIRIVNGIPILDTWEALACGIVHNLAAFRQVWLSFGLDVSVSHHPENSLVTPTFEVRDSAQVLPFLSKGSHELFNDDADGSSSASSDGHDDDRIKTRSNRRRKVRQSDFRNLRPAKDRFAKTLMIVHIHGKPSALPLSTLSKGRLPADNPAINAALELGLTQCLRTLQQFNPFLLLSANALLSSERDARYVPLLASAVTSIACHFESRPNHSLLNKIRSWHVRGSDCGRSETQGSSSASDMSGTESDDAISDGSRNWTKAEYQILVNLMEDQIRRRLQDAPDRAGGARKKNTIDNASCSDARSDPETSSRRMSRLHFLFSSSSVSDEASDDASSVQYEASGNEAVGRDAAGVPGDEAVIRLLDESDDWF